MEKYERSVNRAKINKHGYDTGRLKRIQYTNSKVEESWVMFSGGTIPDMGPLRLRKIELDWGRRT